nr:carboxypeptidase-like regulatory domain-containing protein [Bacteroidaceae bacterium]
MQRKKTFNAFGTLKASLLSVLMSFCVIAAFAQSGTVKGTVTDDTGEPVIGANVVEKGSTNGTITDIDGNYTLQVTNMNGVLQFSFIGYNTTEENIEGRTTINVQLSSGVINLGEVVAIGYGTQTRREITGSVANVDEASFNKGISRDA